MKPSLFAAAVAASILAQPVAAVEQAQPPMTYCDQNVYALEGDELVDCVFAMLGSANTDAPTPTPGALQGSLSAEEGESCWWPGWRTVEKRGTESKWTPLFGSNSPMQGVGEFTTENGNGAELEVSFSFRGQSVKTSVEHTTSRGISVYAENGASRVAYQWISWTEFEGLECGWDWKWHSKGKALMPTDYKPGGTPARRIGVHEGQSVTTDFDNTLYPQGYSPVTVSPR